MDRSCVDKSRLSALWTSQRYVLHSVKLMLLMSVTALFLETKFVINFKGHYSANYDNGTDLGFFTFLRLLPQT